MSKLIGAATAIASIVLRRYTGSHDFNGVPADALAELVGLNEDTIREVLESLLHQGEVSLCFEDSVNPHIKRLPDHPIETQISKLHTENLCSMCVYPSSEALAHHIGPHAHVDRPYTRLLYLGAPQLEPRFFDMAVLERYRNDPRYHFNFEHFSGRISITSAAADGDDMAERDKIFLQSFGLAISDKSERKIAVFLRYLKDLSPEHQQYWRSFEVNSNNIEMVPEYLGPLSTETGRETNQYTLEHCMRLT